MAPEPDPQAPPTPPPDPNYCSIHSFAKWKFPEHIGDGKTELSDPGICPYCEELAANAAAHATAAIA